MTRTTRTTRTPHISADHRKDCALSYLDKIGTCWEQQAERTAAEVLGWGAGYVGGQQAYYEATGRRVTDLHAAALTYRPERDAKAPPQHPERS